MANTSCECEWPRTPPSTFPVRKLSWKLLQWPGQWPALQTLAFYCAFRICLCFVGHLDHRIELNRRTTRVGTFEVCVPRMSHYACFIIMQVLGSELTFLAIRNAELAAPPLFWPVNCIKIGGRVELLSEPTVYSLYCDLDSAIFISRLTFIGS